MLITRRDFLKATAGAGAAIVLNPFEGLGKSKPDAFTYFTLHPFIESHPDAVFIMKTGVDVKTNAAAIKQAALALGRTLFVGNNTSGIPVSGRIALKPNITCRDKANPLYTVEGTMGIVTDSNFVEGIIESIKELGVKGSSFYIRETNCPADLEDGGYNTMAARTGVDIKDLSANVSQLDPSDIQWVDIESGTWFKRLPFLWPVNDPDTWLLNISKFKTHAMGMTLCAKNLQGTIAHDYQAHCTPINSDMQIDPAHFHQDAKEKVRASYEKHKLAGIPRWDKPGDLGGIWQELWASRCLDTNSVTKPGLNIIEGIYGRDGHFVTGPGPTGLATDYMTNVIIFGKNAFHTDIIGTYLAGHEPGNFGLFHMALEKGLSKMLNPSDVPLFEWKADGSAEQKTLKDFTRTPLKTYYLQRDYNGQNEDYWHLCNEPFDYPVSAERKSIGSGVESFKLMQNYPNPFNPTTCIEFTIPEGGNLKLEVFNSLGQVTDIIAEGYFHKGTHMVSWNGHGRPSGVYIYRLLFNGSARTGRMTLLK